MKHTLEQRNLSRIDYVKGVAMASLLASLLLVIAVFVVLGSS